MQQNEPFTYNPMQNLLKELPPEVAAQLLRHLPQIADAMTERVRQDNKFGPQDRPPVEWFLILSEEVGEVAKECVEIQFNDAAHPYANLANYRKELVETVAVGLAALLNFDTRAERDVKHAARMGMAEMLHSEPSDLSECRAAEGSAQVHPENLVAGLSGQVERVAKLVDLYETTTNGNFAAAFMKADLAKARAALAAGDIADMVTVYKDLQGYSE